MPTPRILLSTFGASAVVLLTASATPIPRATLSAQTAAKMGNPITGEGLPNPAPKVTRNWGELPAGRKWGTSAGLDIDPKDGHIWGYERCGAGTLGGAGGGGTTCETNDVDPVFKFDRHTGKVLANFGKGIMITPHGIHVDQQGNVWIADFAGNKEGTKGHQVHKFSSKGEKLLSLGIAGKPGNADGQFNQPNDVVVGPDGSIYVSDGHDAQGMTTNQAIAEGLKRGATSRISKFTLGRQVRQVVGKDRRAPRRVPHAARADVRRQGPSLGGGSRQPPARDLRSGRQIPRVALHVRAHQRVLHQRQPALRDRLGVGSAEPPELA